MLSFSVYFTKVGEGRLLDYERNKARFRFITEATSRETHMNPSLIHGLNNEIIIVTSSI